MWILLICIGVTITAIALGILFECESFIPELCGVLAVFGILGSVGMGIAAIITNTGIEGKIASNQQLHDSLVYQLEHNLYDNDNDIGKLELYEKITDWNCDLARGKAMQHDPWVGIFYPDIYDNFNFIELKE